MCKKSSLVKTAVHEYCCEVIGIRDGFDGLIDERGITPLEIMDVRGILPRDGTILGTSKRGNPYARKVIRNGREIILDVSDEILRGIERLKMDALTNAIDKLHSMPESPAGST